MAERKVKAYVPDRGHVVWCDFDPTVGHEQAKRRPALVITTAALAKHTGLAWLLPITSKGRGTALEVEIRVDGTGGSIAGSALVHQLRAIDYKDREIQFIGEASPEAVQAAIERVVVLASR